MSKRLVSATKIILEKISEIGLMLEKELVLAIDSIEKNDTDSAKLIIANDSKIDKLEVEIEEECLNLIVLHQPVAKDLRVLVGIIKINYDLERVGDLISNIAERSLTLAKIAKPPKPPFDVKSMVEKTIEMLHDSLEAFFSNDSDKALKVRNSDSEIDLINKQMYHSVENELRKNPIYIEALLQYMSISKYLERIADHATNIAEDVIYSTTGEIIRHKF